MPPAAFDPVAHGWTALPDDGFIALVGPVWRRPAKPVSDYGLLTRPEHANRNGVVHGGVLLTFADQVMGLASWEANGERGQATAQLGLQFASGVTIGEFVEGRATVVRVSRSLVFMTGVLSVGERVVATGSGVWKMFESAKR